MKKKLVIVLVTILLLIVCCGHFSCRYFLAQDKLKVEYRLNNMDEAVKDFLSKYNLTQPFLVLQNKEPRDLLTEIIIIGKYHDSLKTIFADGENGVYAYPKEYMKKSTIQKIRQCDLLDSNANELDKLNFVMFIKTPESNITEATICFLESGYFIVFNYYANKKEL